MRDSLRSLESRLNAHSDHAYYWLDARTTRLGRWLDANIARILIIVLFTLLAIWGFLLEDQDTLDVWRRLVRSLGPTLAGIVIAAVTIEALAERRMQQERKAQLIRQMGSSYRDITEMAVIELRHNGWLQDGSLCGANLVSSDLSNAKLSDANLNSALLLLANLRQADFSGANLSAANLSLSDMSGALIEATDLSGADLTRANMTGVVSMFKKAKLCKCQLREANLRKAFLLRCDLSRADLTEANLDGAYLQLADLSEAQLELAGLNRADLANANLSGAQLARANLTGANLRGTRLKQASLYGADLRNVANWTIMQLSEAKKLDGAKMPDGAQLGRTETRSQVPLEGPTFEQWSLQYLAEHGGTVEDQRDYPGKPRLHPVTSPSS